MTSISVLSDRIDNFKEKFSASLVLLFKYCKFRDKLNHAPDSTKRYLLKLIELHGGLHGIT